MKGFVRNSQRICAKVATGRPGHRTAPIKKLSGNSRVPNSCVRDELRAELPAVDVVQPAVAREEADARVLALRRHAVPGLRRQERGELADRRVARAVLGLP